MPYYNDLESGYLLLRQGNGYFSKYFKKHASEEKVYSHIGILSIENDTVYVYHSEASELTGVGFVKREKVGSFLANIEKYDFFSLNYPDSIKSKVVNKVKTYYSKKTPFDLSFDSFNDNELYCTELIAVSINYAVERTAIKPSLGLNGKLLYSLDDIYLCDGAKKMMFNASETKN